MFGWFKKKEKKYHLLVDFILNDFSRERRCKITIHNSKDLSIDDCCVEDVRLTVERYIEDAGFLGCSVRIIGFPKKRCYCGD